MTAAPDPTTIRSPLLAELRREADAASAVHTLTWPFKVAAVTWFLDIFAVLWRDWQETEIVRGRLYTDLTELVALVRPVLEILTREHSTCSLGSGCEARDACDALAARLAELEATP